MCSVFLVVVEALTCPASLLSTSSCLLLISGVPGQLPPPPPPPISSPPPPFPRESWEKDTVSTSEGKTVLDFFFTFWIQRDERSEIVSLLCGCFACFDLHFYWFYRFFSPLHDFMGFSWWLALRDLKLADYIGFAWWLFYWMNRDVFVAGTTRCESFWAHEICAPANKLLCHLHHPLKVPAKSKVTIKLLKQ